MRGIEVIPKKHVDHSGKTYGKWIGLPCKKIIRNNKGRLMWPFRCGYCNGIKLMVASEVTTNHTKSCGCLGKLGDQTNKKYNMLTGLPMAKQERDSDGNLLWLWQCDCGSPPKLIMATYVINGITQSCSCLKGGKISVLSMIFQFRFLKALGLMRTHSSEQAMAKHFVPRSEQKESGELIQQT